MSFKLCVFPHDTVKAPEKLTDQGIPGRVEVLGFGGLEPGEVTAERLPVFFFPHCSQCGQAITRFLVHALVEFALIRLPGVGDSSINLLMLPRPGREKMDIEHNMIEIPLESLRVSVLLHADIPQWSHEYLCGMVRESLPELKAALTVLASSKIETIAKFTDLD